MSRKVEEKKSEQPIEKDTGEYDHLSYEETCAKLDDVLTSYLALYQEFRIVKTQIGSNMKEGFFKFTVARQEQDLLQLDASAYVNRDMRALNVVSLHEESTSEGKVNQYELIHVPKEQVSQTEHVRSRLFATRKPTGPSALREMEAKRKLELKEKEEKELKDKQSKEKDKKKIKQKKKKKTKKKNLPKQLIYKKQQLM